MRSDSTNRWAVILAGGEGSRLRPLTRRIAGDERPKQFCAILGGETLLDRTRRRVSLGVPADQTAVVVTRTHERFYLPLLRDMPPHGVVVQPENQGTAPAIFYGLLRIATVAPAASVAFFPSDHYFSDDEKFMSHVEAALNASHLCEDMIILLGIIPEGPEVGYGWIEPAEPVSKGLFALRRVRRFWEKPSLAKARKLMAVGSLWNSFVMVGRVSAFLEMIRRATPQLYDRFVAVQPSLNTAKEEGEIRSLYSELPSTNFSQQVLAARPSDLSVLPVNGVRWSDWGGAASRSQRSAEDRKGRRVAIQARQRSEQIGIVGCRVLEERVYGEEVCPCSDRHRLCGFDSRLPMPECGTGSRDYRFAAFRWNLRSERLRSDKLGLPVEPEKWAEQIPTQRIARAEEMAKAALFLASDDSS